MMAALVKNSLLLIFSVFMTQKTLAHFVLEYEIISVTTHVTGCGADESTLQCETYLSHFCLREGRGTLSNDTLDCPLGFGSTIAFGENYPAVREITSNRPWTVSHI